MKNNDRIIQIISKYSNTPVAEISLDTGLLADLRMESMNFIDMICEFEGDFKINIPERDFRRFITVRRIIEYFDGVISNGVLYFPEDFHDSGDAGFTESHCIVSPMTKSLSKKVPELVTAVYGATYPIDYLYNPKEFWGKVEKGELYPYIAINGDGKATGMISLIKLPMNTGAFELGQLMVIPEYRGSDLAELLISNISKQELKCGVIYCESVTTHKFSQRSCISGGFFDTALKLNISPSYKKTDRISSELSHTAERISCVVSCIERGQTGLWAYLPKFYKQAIEFSLSGLSPRVYRNASDTSPGNPTCYTINDDELTTSQYAIISITEIGDDVTEVVQGLDEYAVDNSLKSLVVNIPLSCPHNGSMVNALRSSRFFFGGVMPRWFPDSDALLMQKLYLNKPDWNNIKLFSDRIKIISDTIRKETAE